MKKVALLCIIGGLLISCVSMSMPSDADLTQGGSWEINHFVDEFGFDTDTAFIGSHFSGTFSNSAVQNARLSGKAFVYEDMGQLTLRLDLYEYGNNPANFIGSNAHFAAATSTERLKSGYSGVHGNSFFFYNQNAQPIVEALARGEEVRILIDGNYQTEWMVNLIGYGFGYQLQQYLNN